jgi:hypothetical protein
MVIGRDLRLQRSRIVMYRAVIESWIVAAVYCATRYGSFCLPDYAGTVVNSSLGGGAASCSANAPEPFAVIMNLYMEDMVYFYIFLGP